MEEAKKRVWETPKLAELDIGGTLGGSFDFYAETTFPAFGVS